MKFLPVFSLFLFSIAQSPLWAQSDSSTLNAKPHRTYTARDTLYLVKLNHTSNLMIAGGIGLICAGTYLIVEGSLIYSSPATPNSTNPAADIMRNHNQGTAYIAAGGIAAIGGAVLTALGAVDKVDFKRRKRLMSLQAGLLISGNLGGLLSF